MNLRFLLIVIFLTILRKQTSNYVSQLESTKHVLLKSYLIDLVHAFNLIKITLSKQRICIDRETKLIHECFNLIQFAKPKPKRRYNTTLYICTFIHVRVIHVTIVNLIQLFNSGCACIFNMGCYWSKTVYKQYTHVHVYMQYSHTFSSCTAHQLLSLHVYTIQYMLFTAISGS